MTEKPDPLPNEVNKYVIENHDATPDEVIEAVELDESRRGQVEHYLAVTRYAIYNELDENDGEDLALNDVEWSDVNDWSTDKES